MKIPDKIRIPIVVKLVSITVLLLLIATTAIAFRSSFLFESISGPRERDANGVAAEAKAAQVNVVLEKYLDKTKLVASLLYKKYNTEEEKQEALNLTFYSDSDLVAIEIYELKDGKLALVDYVDKKEFLAQLNLSSEACAITAGPYCV